MCCTPGVSSFWRPRQEDPQLEAILAYRVRPSLKKRNQECVHMSSGRRAFRPRALHMQRHGNLKAKGKEGTEPQLSIHHFRAHT